jgi:hypothetical protein
VLIEHGLRDRLNYFDESNRLIAPVDQFAALCRDAVSTYGIKGGLTLDEQKVLEAVQDAPELTIRPEEVPRPAPKTDRGTSSAWAAERREQARDLLQHFEHELRETELGDRFAEEGHAAVPGQLYRVVRRSHRSIYCKAPVGFDKPLVSYRAKPRAVRMTARLPLQRVEDQQHVANRLPSTPIVHVDDGRFRIELEQLGYDESTELAKLLTELVKDGRIDLLGS